MCAACINGSSGEDSCASMRVNVKYILSNMGR